MSVTVTIPVGPFDTNKKWLLECLDSVAGQTVKADQILIIDDMANLDSEDKAFAGIDIWKSPWRLGIPAVFNVGVALARNDLVIMLGSDDKLEPAAIERLLNTYESKGKADGYYFFTIVYSDDGVIQDVPNNCAAVTKGLWRLTGGFPPEAGVGACDSIFISMMLKHNVKKLFPVDSGNPLYWYRRHWESDTGARPVGYQQAIHTVRDVFTTTWKKPTWT